MSGVNKVILLGHVGKDPEIRHLENGVTVANFSLATSESYKNKEGTKVESTEWHNIVMWRGIAEVAEKYVRKGTQLYLEGKIKTKSYEDKAGVKKYTTEIHADTMNLIGRKPEENGKSFKQEETASEVNESFSAPNKFTDGLPF